MGTESMLVLVQYNNLTVTVIFQFHLTAFYQIKGRNGHLPGSFNFRLASANLIIQQDLALVRTAKSNLS